jgi:hypothetical protein
MARIHSFHSASGASEFLGLRTGRRGGTEIVYDDGVARRIVFRVVGPAQGPAGGPGGAPADTGALGDALQRAVNQPRVLSALYSELKRRAIAVEQVMP